MMELCC